MKPSRFKNVLKKFITIGKPVLVVGSPGIGKTDIIKETTSELGYDLIISHPVVDSPLDYKGMPYAHNKEASFLPFGNLKKIINAEKPTVFFIDDLGQAPDTVQAALMQLLLSREINENKISDNVVFVAATNRKSDKAAVSAILEPVKSRFISIIDLDVDPTDWIVWASENNMPTELIAFINIKPDLLIAFEPTHEIKNSPCPRTVANIGMIQNANFDEEDIVELFIGAAGEKFASEYIMFLDIYRKAPKFSDIITNPENCQLPDITDASLRNIICVNLKSKANVVNFDSIVKYVKRMGNEYAQFIITAIVSDNENLKSTKTYTDWVVQNQDWFK